MDGTKGVEYGAEALYKVNDAQNRVDALEKKVALLEEHNKELLAACEANALAVAGIKPPPTGC